MSLNKEQMLTLFRNLVRADHWDQMFLSRIFRGQLIGFYHPGSGGIAPGVGACSFLKQDDILWPHHRAHGMAHLLSKGIDLKTYLAEHTGKETGCCKGRSSFHFCYPEHMVFSASGFIGMNFPFCIGHGWAAKQNDRGQVVMCCSGDGSYGEGRAHEALLMAMNEKLPIIFFCENNEMAIYAEAKHMHPMKDISSLAGGYGMPATVVDGQDVFAVAEVVLESISRVRKGKGPVFIEAKTCRFREHDIGTPDLVGSTQRSEAVIEKLKERDPVRVATEQILESGTLSQKAIDEIYAEARKEIEDAEQFADESPIAQPSEQELLSQVYAP